MDKQPNGHFGFRFIFALIGIGEDNWSHVQKDMITEFCFYRSFYVRFYGENKIVDKLLKSLDCFVTRTPREN